MATNGASRGRKRKQANNTPKSRAKRLNTSAGAQRTPPRSGSPPSPSTSHQPPCLDVHNRPVKNVHVQTSVTPTKAVIKQYRNVPTDIITGKRPCFDPTIREIQYHPLIKAEEDVALPDLMRVLILQPGIDDKIVCKLEIRLLSPLDARGFSKEMEIDGISKEDITRYTGRYMALSYAWEGQKPSVSIYLEHPKGEQEFKATKNLASALKSLRHPTEPRTFWADAICMDQLNPDEKSQQLPLMPRIYGEADMVCVWLGNEEADTEAAFKLMHDIRDWKNFSRVASSTKCSEWTAFTNLISKPWFKRRWVVQEVVLAGNAELCCGPNHRISWKEFAQSVAFFELMEDQVRNKFRQDKDSDNPPDMFGAVRHFPANRLVKTAANVVRRRDDGRVEKKTESLELLLSSLTPFVAGNPEDIIYSILSLAKDVKATAKDVILDKPLQKEDLKAIFESKMITSETEKERLTRLFNRIRRNLLNERFPISFKKSFDEVCEDVYKFITRRSRSIDMICRPWAPIITGPERKMIPTWVRSVEGQAYEDEKDESHVRRVNADTLVGLPGRSPYKADAGLRGEWDFIRDGPVSGKSRGQLILSATGFQFDEIGDIGDVAEAGTIPRSWLEYRQPSDGEGTQSVSDQFWRTMVAGKGPDGEDPPLTYELISQSIFAPERPGAPVRSINLPHDQTKDTNPIRLKFFSRVLSVITNRRLTRTTRQNCLALVPEGTETGDVVCILYGCSVPVVLRNTGEKTTEVLNSVSTNGNTDGTRHGGEDVWELVGECYMYGMMFGEALERRREGEASGDPEAKDFYKNLRVFNIR